LVVEALVALKVVAVVPVDIEKDQHPSMHL
jgi:hypothetical protein